MIVSERVRAELRASSRFITVIEFTVIDSTNRWLLDAAKRGAPEGTVAVADFQRAGRGRMARPWATPPGTNLLVSVLLRPSDLPPARRHLAVAAVALATRAAAATVAGVAADLKWPNDLLVGEAKLAGILAGTVGDAVVVGVGCNVGWAPAGAAALVPAGGRPVDRGELLGALLGDLETRLGRWDAVAADYRAACVTVGREVRVEHSGGATTGTVEEIDDDGRLVLRGADGQLGVLNVGDVVHVRPACA